MLEPGIREEGQVRARKDGGVGEEGAGPAGRERGHGRGRERDRVGRIERGDGGENIKNNIKFILHKYLRFINLEIYIFETK